MTTQGPHPASMDQKIFQMPLSVEEISLYLLCCGLADIGKPITYNNLIEVWNSDASSLQSGLQRLERLKVIKRYISDQKAGRAYLLMESNHWVID